jgi:hypothetical protein
MRIKIQISEKRAGGAGGGRRETGGKTENGNLGTYGW